MSRQTAVPREVQERMKKPPEALWYRGDLQLLERPRVSIVGSRRPSTYTRQATHSIARALSSRGVVVVSGAAMGVDALAHQGAGPAETIAVMPSGVDVRYPAINRPLIEQIEAEGLIVSQFNPGFLATPWSFVVRNELVVALGDILVITEAGEESGSMRSAEYAISMGREIYVLPHRIDESLGTNRLLREGLAKPIYDVDTFANTFGKPTVSNIPRDDFYYFCQTHPTIEQAIARYGERVYEAELAGEIAIVDGRLRII